MKKPRKDAEKAKVLAKDVSPEDSIQQKWDSVKDWVLKTVHDFCRTHSLDFADCFDAAQLKVVEIFPRWDPKKGALTTFVKKCVGNILKDYLRRYGKTAGRPTAYFADLGPPASRGDSTKRLGSLLEGLQGDAKILVSLILGDADSMIASGFVESDISSRRAWPETARDVFALAKLLLSGKGWSAEKLSLAYGQARGVLYGVSDEAASGPAAPGRRRLGDRTSRRKGPPRR